MTKKSCKIFPSMQRVKLTPRTSVKSVEQKYFSDSPTETYVVGAQKNRLNETVLLSPQNLLLKLRGKKIFTILHSKMLFI